MKILAYFPSYNHIKKLLFLSVRTGKILKAVRSLAKWMLGWVKRAFYQKDVHHSLIQTLLRKVILSSFSVMLKKLRPAFIGFGKWRIEANIHVSWITLFLNMNIFFLQALATLRQKLRKYNKDFEEDILKYREVSLTFIIHLGSIQAESPIRWELIPVSIAWSDQEYLYTPWMGC